MSARKVKMEIPSAIYNEDGVDISNCKIRELPDDFQVNGNAIIYCDSNEYLEKLPTKSNARSFYISGSPKISDFPCLTIPGMFIADDCKGLTAIPDNLQVGSDLIMRACRNLRSVGDCITIGANLDLEQCTNLETIGEGLTVRGDLRLMGCNSLTLLPSDISVGGTIDLTGCNGINIPENIISKYGNRITLPHEYNIIDEINNHPTFS